MGISNQGKKPSHDLFTTKGVLPTGIVGTGTFTVASGVRVIGTGTLFKTEVNNGDYLHDTTLNEVRRVKHVLNPLLILLDTAFSGAVAGAAVGIIRKQDISNQLSIGVLNDGAGVGVLDEVALSIGSSDNWSDEGGVGPITFDGTGTTLVVSQKTRG